jgi:hypothetical protein
MDKQGPGTAFYNPNQRIGANLAYMDKAEAILGGFTTQTSVLDERLYRMVQVDVPVEPSRAGERGSPPGHSPDG